MMARMMMMVMSDEGGRKGGCGNGISGAGMNPTRECECGCREYRHGDPYGGDHVPVCDIYIVEMEDDDDDGGPSPPLVFGREAIVVARTV
mmetsp:Transcript_23617/g.42705  ORF Transcript_23617/g.42705 Transcript_23617/m.42705 type:complete len:90 (+) Transcript_23617:308-577(+)